MKYTFFLCLLLKALSVFSTNAYNFKQIDIKNGLSNNNVNCILKDCYGFMWFATDNGINRYDGYRFKHYNVSDNKIFNRIKEIKEDCDGNIWIQAFNTMFYYNRTKDVIEADIQSVLKQYISAEHVELLFVDHNHNLWCVSGRELYYYNYKKKQQQVFSLPEHNSVKRIECRDQQAFILFDTGLVGWVDFDSNAIFSELNVCLSAGEHQEIFIDYAYNLWFYTAYSPDNVLRRYNPKTKQWRAITDKAKHICDFIASVTDDGKGDIWVASVDAGVYIYHQNNDSFTHIINERNNPFSLPCNHINSLYKDEQNVMWVGTAKRGVAYINLNNIRIERNQWTEVDDISCILEDNSGNIWLGSDGEGIARMNVQTGQTTLFTNGKGDIPMNLIISSYLDSQNRIWFGTYGGGAFYYEKGKFCNLAIKEQHFLEVLKDVRSIEEDNAGNIWLGTINEGLFCYNKEGDMERYTMENSALPTNSITSLYCKTAQKLYIGTGVGLCVMDTYSRQLVRLDKNNENTSKVPTQLLKCIYKDSRNLLWIGGQNGLYIWDTELGSVFHLTTENGLSHNSVVGITEDLNGNIWITTDLGITNIVVINDPVSKTPIFRCYRYYEEDGLGNITFNPHSIYCNKKGEILMGGIGGYVKAIPEPIQINKSDNRIVFTALRVANKLIDVGEPSQSGKPILTKNIQLTHEITLDYTDNTFALDVSSMNYDSPQKITFFYRLSEGEEWKKLLGNTIDFIALSPDTYHLQVKAQYNEKHWTDETALLVIHVKPPFWLSSTAYSFYLLLTLMAFIMLVVRLQRRTKLQMKLHTMEMSIKKKNEIDEAKMRFLTNISHDLRTPLSLIITPLERLLNTENCMGDVRNDLELMHRNAILMLEEVNQLLELRRLDNGKSSLNLSHGDLAVFVKEVCTSFECNSASKGVKFNVEVKGEAIEMDFDRNKIQRVLMNLISNALKFNVEDGSVTVTVKTIYKDENEFAVIEVADTGIGIKDTNKKKIFERFYQEIHDSSYIGSGIGLHIVKEYVQMHGGEIEVKDNIPQGALFVITLPVKYSVGKECVVEEGNVGGMETVTDYLILVVEDNDDFRQFIYNCLKKHYQVLMASNGKNALEIMEKQSVQLVISDVMMPMVNGYELCNRIKNDIRYSHIPIILLTARNRDEHILEGLQEGADDYITKPFNLDILLLRIGKLIDRNVKNRNMFKRMEIEPSEITISSLDEQLISKAIALVEENMSNSNYSVENLSADIGMSRGHLYKKLMAITGKAPKEFIITLRIKRGRQLVEKSQLNVSEIAYSVGLSPKQFTKYYKDIYGEVPSLYRKIGSIHNFV